MVKKMNRQDKEFYWIVGMMVGVVLLFAFASYIFSSFNEFEYEGLTFTKEKFDEIPVYHYYYNMMKNDESGDIIKYNLYLRTDVRKNDIPVQGSDIYFPADRFVYVAIGGFELEECENTGIAVSELSAFLTNNQLIVKGASSDVIHSQVKGIKYASCDEYPDNAVIEIKPGDVTRVKTSGLCTEIFVKDCEILEAVEKFEVHAIVDAKARAI